MVKKFLYQPVSPYILNQGFAYNIPCVEKRTDIPLNKRKIVNGVDNFTCPIGYEKLYPQLGLPSGHNGNDLRAYHSQPVYNSQDGFVQNIETEEARGLGVEVVTDQPYFCIETGKDEYFKIRYWHLKGYNVKKGDKVKVGDLIGYANNTGYSSGDHLHWEIKPVSKDGKRNILPNNGYFGAVNPEPYLDPVFAVTAAGLFKTMKEIIAKLSDRLAELLRK